MLEDQGEINRNCVILNKLYVWGGIVTVGGGRRLQTNHLYFNIQKLISLCCVKRGEDMATHLTLQDTDSLGITELPYIKMRAVEVEELLYLSKKPFYTIM